MRLMRHAVTKAFPNDSAAVLLHVRRLSKLSMDELEQLTTTDEGMQKLTGPLADLEADVPTLPLMSDVVEAKPRRLTPTEYARVLSGGTPREWGPVWCRKKG